MGDWAATWVADKLADNPDITGVTVTSAGLLKVEREERSSFKVAALGVEDMVTDVQVSPFFQGSDKPQFVINVPKGAIWTGPAISMVHAGPAGFGGMGDLTRASRLDRVSSYRYKQYQFFEDGLRDHSAVRGVTRLYDRMFMVDRYNLPDLTIVLIDTYNMSAEDVRTACRRYGRFDAALKMTSYGGITSAAKEAAHSMGADTFLWGGLLGRLNKP